jgi:prophage regulatory protein
VGGRRLVEVASLLRLFEKPQPHRRIIREPIVRERTAQSGAVIRRAVKDGTFPTLVRLGLHAIGWFEDEVDAWMAALPRLTFPRPANRNQAPPKME